ncbi:MAG: prolipoprotein diacylglyceryl transferase [Deltaproteobacteria bacterium]|nr:prolipoprotein diacylglyceryl transferase [Deltaproteobacteria bacterium]
MHPVLFSIGPVSVSTYGVMIAIGLLFAIMLSKREGTRQGFDSKDIIDMSFWSILSGLIGAHILFAIVNFREYLEDPVRFLTFWRGGVVWYGGLAGGIIGGGIFLKIRKMDFWKVADVVAAPLAIGLFFGRFGCLSAGCCYGKPTSFPFGIVYPEISQLAPPGITLQPSPLYECLLMLIIFFYLTIIRSRKRYNGQLFLIHLTLYSIGRFFLEMLRGDELRGSIFHLDLIKGIPGWEILSTSQAVGIVLLVFALSIMWIKDKKISGQPDAGTVFRLKRMLFGGA